MTPERMLEKFRISVPRVRTFFRRIHNLYLIKSSGLFDRELYLKSNPDVARTGLDPALHYLYYGGFEGRDPGPHFHSRWYIDTYEDVHASGLNPLIHYLKYGRKEGRQTRPQLHANEDSTLLTDVFLIRASGLFDEFWYLATNPDVAKAGMDPIVHYLLHGCHEGRDPSPNFHNSWYLEAYPDVQKAGMNPLIHYLRWGREEGREKGWEEGREARIFRLSRMYDYSKQAGRLVFEDTPEQIYLTCPKVLGAFSGDLKEGATVCPPAYVSLIEDAMIFGGSNLVIAEQDRLLSDELVDFTEEEIGIKSPLVKLRQEDTLLLEYKKESSLQIKEGVLISCDHDNNYFHWLVECLPKLVFLDEIDQFKEAPLLIPKGLHKNLEEALRRVNVNDRPLIYIEPNVAYQVERLIYLSPLSRVLDRYQGQPVFDADIVLSHKWINKVGDLIKENLNDSKKPGRKLFLTRKKGLRALENREELELALLKQGFEIVELDGVSLDFQIELFSQASLIVAPTGATLTNMLFCRPGTKVIILMSNHEVTNFYFWSNLAAVNGLDVKTIAGQRLFNLTNYWSVHDDYVIDIDLVLEEIKIRIVFLVQYTFIFNSYFPLFLTLTNLSNVKTYICMIPNVDARMQDINVSEAEKTLKDVYKVRDYLVDYDGTALKSLAPDAVFVQTPYDSQRPEAFSAENLSKFTKVCYIPYGIGIADCPGYHYGLDFYNHCWKIFLEAPISLKMCRDYLGEEGYLRLRDKLVVSGSPKIEMTMNYEHDETAADSLWRLPRNPATKRIIWAPHWTFEWKISGDGIPRNGYSQFLKYYRFFLETARRNQNIDLVLRAHPLMYTEIVNRGLMTTEELESFRQEFSALPNARIDDAIANSEAYLGLFFSSDAMITDGISFLTEYPITGKPLLHTLGTDNPARLNAYGDRIAKAFYQAFCEEDIVRFIDEVVFKGMDEMLEQRKRIIAEELYIPAAGISRTIGNDIINSLP